jgi:hypothetical protein
MTGEFFFLLRHSGIFRRSMCSLMGLAEVVGHQRYMRLRSFKIAVFLSEINLRMCISRFAPFTRNNNSQTKTQQVFRRKTSFYG